MDWAAGFDMLSILLVKIVRLGVGRGEQKKMEHSLTRQLGESRYREVCLSLEYQDLYYANLALFDGVEKVRHGDGMSAKEFDDLNQARHRAKQVLQKRFWGNELTEIKT